MFRLAHRCGDAKDVRIYGTRGQAQDGIDVYVRRSTGDYETWQCKRYQEPPKRPAKAVTKFLEGDRPVAPRNSASRVHVAPRPTWRGRSKTRALLEAKKIKFKPMDRDGLSERLKSEPDLVMIFLAAIGSRCSTARKPPPALPGRKLTREQRLRAGRSSMAFTRATSSLWTWDFPGCARLSWCDQSLGPRGALVEPDIELVESVVEEVEKEVRRVERDSSVGSTRRKTTISQVLRTNDRLLLVGAAGFGKSTAMRMVVMDLLGTGGRFGAVAKKWGNRLPPYSRSVFWSHFPRRRKSHGREMSARLAEKSRRPG